MMNKRRNHLPLIVMALCGLMTTPAWSAPQVLDRVAAVVDEGVVMESELRSEMQTIMARMQAQDADIPPEEVLRSQVMEHLIVQELQLQMAERAGVTVSDSEVNQAIAELQRRNNVSREQFIAQLQREGMSLEELRAQIRREITISRVQRGAVGNRLDITEQDVENFLNSKEGQFWTAPEYRLGHILIPVASAAGDQAVAQAKQQAMDLYKQLQNGADFAQLATTYSAGQKALEGGNLGWRKPAQLPQLFATQLQDMNSGDVSEPFRSGAGFHILKIHAQRGGGQQMVEQTKVRHILLEPSVILSDEEARQQLLDIRQQILDGEVDFETMAREHSKDPGSMMAGGDLGWSMPGQFVPPFEKVMNATTKGEISYPFQTQHGWHILQVQERRQKDMSDEVKRNRARQLLQNRRFEEELPIWLQEIRDRAYVDIKIDDVEVDIDREQALNQP